MKLKKFQRTKWLWVALLGFLILLTLGAYFKVFHAEFVYDDFGFIVNNKDIQSFKPFSKFFLSPDIFTGSNYVSEKSGGRNWRPVASFTFAVEYALFGKNPTGFHFVSILLHILNLILVYLLVIKLTKRIGIAALVTLFWSLHPTSTEAVSWVTNQSSLIFLGFFLLAVLAILGYLKDKNKKFLLWISYLFFTLSLLTKETALGGIFIIPLVFLLEGKGQEKINFRKILINSYPFVLIGLAYFYAHYKILGALGDHALRGSFFQNLLLVPTVFYKYISLAVYPVNLLLNYANFPLPTGVSDHRVILGAVFFFAFAALIYLGFKKSWFNFILGAVWFLAFLIPVLQIIPFQDIIGERFLYAPLIGFFLVVISGFDNLSVYVKLKYNFGLYPFGKTVAVLALSMFFILTFNRNNDWLNSENLWNSVLKIDPKNERALTNLGVYYIDKRLASKVIEVSEKLLQIDKNSAFGNVEFGVGLAMAGRFEEAESQFLYILSKKPDYQPALLNLSIVYQNTGRYDKALEILQKLSVRYPWDDSVKQRISQLENIVKYNRSPSVISAFGKGEYSYIETELQAPAVEGSIVNSGITGSVVLSGGRPFEASLEIFKTNDISKPFISVRTHDDGTFQIPLRPGFYFLKPLDPDGPITPLQEKYPFNLRAGRWLKFKIEYK